MPKAEFTRRRFLSGAASAAALTIAPRHVLGGARHVAPSGKLNIAGIGVGGMGRANLAQVETENIVALYDVDHNYARGAMTKYSQARAHRDFRVMLSVQGDIDAVVIATPDHTHAVISMAAIKAGKHVYRAHA